MANKNNFQLSGKRVLVTGGTGFVGSHLVEQLLADGANVVVTQQSYNPQSYFSTQQLDQKSVVITADVSDFATMAHIISRHEVEYIFHLAAQPLVAVAYNNPRQTLATNIMGTVNILECARLFAGVQGVIVASSDKAYGKLAAGKYLETDALAGTHPYEVSKSSADLICTAYYKTYGIPVVISRFGNIYGEGDLNFSRIVPAILAALITNQKLELRSDGTFVRDYLYVKDVIAGYLLLLAHLDTTKGQAYNFGSPDTLSVLDLVATCEKTLQKKIPYTILNTAKNEIAYQSLDYTKAKQLGWTPKGRITTTIPGMYQWYRKVFARGLQKRSSHA